jgi:predicted NACHT family NTPase
MDEIYKKPERWTHDLKKIRSGTLLETVENPLNRRLILLGDPGLGKTTALRYFVYRCVERFGHEQSTVPVYIELKFCEGKPLNQAINEFLKDIDIEELAANFKVLLMLDGYNEVSGERIIKLNSEIDTLLKKLDGSQVIITSRKAAYPRVFEGFNTCEVEYLEDKKIELYLSKVFKDNYKDVFVQIKNKGLLEIARIPLFLKFLCDLLRIPESLPDTKGKLLERMIEVKYMHGYEGRLKHKFEVSEDLIMKAFSEFCYNLVRDDRGITFESKELKNFINSKSEWTKDFLAEKIIDEIKWHGLIQGYAGIFSFWHQTILEYFTARHLKEVIESEYERDKKMSLKTFIEHFRYKKWDEILSIFFDLTSEHIKQDILKPFFIQLDSKNTERLSLLLDISKILRIPEHCIDLLKDKDSYVRRSAAFALGEIKSEKAVELLIDLLKDKDSDVRRSAAFALGEIIDELKEKEKINILDRIDKSGVRELNLFLSLKTIRYIAEGIVSNK